VSLFVDSSAWFAAVVAKDRYHSRAVALLGAADRVITTDHVLVETWLLLRARHSWQAAESFARRLLDGWARIEVITLADISAAQSIAAEFPDQYFSLVDRTSFASMQRLGITRVVSFDDDFVVYRFGPGRGRAFEVLR
jgi:predicted nucleic acid-binding protein